MLAIGTVLCVIALICIIGGILIDEGVVFFFGLVMLMIFLPSPNKNENKDLGRPLPIASLAMPTTAKVIWTQPQADEKTVLAVIELPDKNKLFVSLDSVPPSGFVLIQKIETKDQPLKIEFTVLPDPPTEQLAGK